MNKPIKTLISLIFLSIMIVIAYQQGEAPAPDSQSDVDYTKLFEHVVNMTAQPHPIGTPANKEVRDYIVAQFESMGLKTEIQKATVIDQYWRARAGANSMVAHVENIIARLPGSGTGDNQDASDLVLMAHYDSRENALGAGDDISGTASILEVARIMSQGPKPVHDVVFLITDGEEIGLMGAQGFFGQHAAAKQVGLVLNFEARGSSGAPSMFETSNNNAWLIEHIKTAIPDLIGDSLTYEVYRRMPNDTDLSISKTEDIRGLNFAFAKSLVDYHAMTDSSENLDKKSLGVMANYALDATRYFANLEQWQSVESDSTFFTSGFGPLLSYTQLTASIAGCLVLLFGVAMLVTALRKKLTNWRSMGTGSLAVLTVLLFTFSLFQVVVGYAVGLRADAYPENAGLFYLVALGDWPMLAYFVMLLGGLLWFDQALQRGLKKRDVFLPALILALAALATGAWILALLLLLVAVPCLLVLKRSTARVDIWAASLSTWWLLTVLVVFSAPNASYVFVWPLASILLGIAIQMKMQFPINSGGRFALVLLSGFIPLLLLLPLLSSIYILAGSTAPQGVMTLSALCLLLLWPLVKQVGAVSPGRMSLTLMGFGLVAILTLLSIRQYDERHPLGEELFFAVDGETGNSFWVSDDARPGTWIDDFLGDQTVEFDYHNLIPGYFDSADSTPAGSVSVKPARLEVIDDQRGDQRDITLQFDSPVGADYINLMLPATAGISALAINGHELVVPTEFSELGWWRIRWYGLPEEGAVIELLMDPASELTVKVVEVKHEMPEGAPKRPDHSMPRPYTWTDSTVIYQTLTIE